jgi:uncharacterized protein DUF3618
MSSEASPKTEPAELRTEIADTRAKLGGTVEALVHKLDVTGRGKAKAQQIREATLERSETVIASLPEPIAAPTRRAVAVTVTHPAIAVGAAAGAALLVRGVVKRKRR